MEVGIVDTPARFTWTGLTYQRLGVLVVPQVPDDVPHVAELTGGRGEDSLHADQTPVRAGAVTLTHSRQQVRRGPLDHVTGPHLDTAGHGGRLVAGGRHSLHTGLLLPAVQVASGDLDQQNGHDHHQEHQDGDHAGRDGDEVLHLHFHDESVAPVGLHLHGVVGQALARLVLGRAEEGAVLRYAGVGDEQLTPGARAALVLLDQPHARVLTVHQQSVVAPADLRRGVGLDSADQGDVPPLPHRDEHRGGGHGGQTGELLDTDGGQLEARQPARRLTERLVEPRHVGLYQPVPHLPELAVAVPGVAVKGHSVQPRAQLQGVAQHPQPVALQVEPLQANEAVQGPGLDLTDLAARQVQSGEVSQLAEGPTLDLADRVVTEAETHQVECVGEGVGGHRLQSVVAEVYVHQVEQAGERSRVDDRDVVVTNVDLLQIEQLGLGEPLSPEDREAVVADVDHLRGSVNVHRDLRGPDGRALRRHLAGLPQTPTLARTGGREGEVCGEEDGEDREGEAGSDHVTCPHSSSLASLLTTDSVTGVALPSPPAQHDCGSTRHCPVSCLPPRTLSQCCSQGKCCSPGNIFLLYLFP